MFYVKPYWNFYWYCFESINISLRKIDFYLILRLSIKNMVYFFTYLNIIFVPLVLQSPFH